MANLGDKPLVWLKGEVKTPPFSNQARLEAGLLLRRLQQGQGLSLPHSRPMPVSVASATSYESAIMTKHGESFTTSRGMRS
jgi:hypothetical protein